MTAKRPAISFRDVTFGYDRHPAVHHITGEVKSGALLAVIGPNGAGKSTLLKGIVGELRPLGGSIALNGAKASGSPICRSRSRSIACSRSRCSTAWRWGCGARSAPLRGLDGKHEDEVARALATVGLQDLSNRLVGALSGGQFQRVLFARLLLQDAGIILLDEPFRAVDTKTVADLIALIERWHKEGRTVLAALHDIEQVRAHFPDTLILRAKSWPGARRAKC